MITWSIIVANDVTDFELSYQQECPGLPQIDYLMLQASSLEEDRIPRHLFATYPEESELKIDPRYVFNVFSRLKKVRGGPQEDTFDHFTRMTKSVAKNQDGILFQRLAKKSKSPSDEEIFERLTKRYNTYETGIIRITKKNDQGKISDCIIFSNLPFQKMKYAGLKPLANVVLT